ncbi:MAG: TMEM175 family protein [Ginsengibacter sp.]
MNKGRLEAFSDGVLAIIITIMVLEMKVPHGDSFESLKPLIPVFISYVLSFIYIGIYWNNHHHMMHSVKHVNGNVLWANTHLLFWLSLVPFATGWMGENNFTKWPVLIYGFVLCMAGIAYTILTLALIRINGKQSTLAIAVGRDRKGKLSIIFYLLGITVCFIHPFLGMALYTATAVMWFIPDKRIESKMKDEHETMHN